MGGSISVVNECFYQVTVSLNGGLIDEVVLPSGHTHTFEGTHIGRVHMRVGAARERIERRTPVEGADSAAGNTPSMQFLEILPEQYTSIDFVFCDGRLVKIKHDPTTEDIVVEECQPQS